MSNPVFSLSRPRLPALLLAALVLCLLSGQAEASSGPRRGDPTPAFALPDLQGKTLRLPEAARGKVLVLHFWGSTCAYCREEIRILNQLQREYPQELLPVSINVGETLPTVNKFIDKLNPGYPVLLDGNSAVAKQFGIYGIPVTYLADRDGVIRFRIFGEINEPGLRKLLAVVLPRQ